MLPVRTLAVASLLAAVAAPARAQDGGRHAAAVLSLPAAPRAAALADAFTAVGGDEASLFYSPAQLATVRGRGVSASVERFLATTLLGAAVGAVRVAGGTAAVGVRSLQYPDAPEAQEYEPTGRTVTGGELAVTAGFARALWGVRAGASATLVRQRVAEASGQTIAGDVGLAWTVPAASATSPLPRRALAGLTVAGALQHLGGELSLLGRASPLPRRMRVGIARPTTLTPTLSLLTTAEVVQLDGEAARPAAGAELRWQRGHLSLDARGGVRRRLLRDEAMPAHTVGAGLGFRAVGLDYAYQGYAALGATHRLGVRWAP
ncbi:hypothetical protein [Roseisolibacter agri]|uniref:Autotransporter domain-containing protein n=1 Tax=Roseisolibacter agri TaxID=2014610 RepID=A0AA37V1D7_9BACT|nr:hypothetical protein [Roseisolibacter agri]GLC26020.1 hypothetical protein rosag_25330 [Roseisolibacter agri]